MTSSSARAALLACLLGPLAVTACGSKACTMDAPFALSITIENGARDGACGYGLELERNDEPSLDTPTCDAFDDDCLCNVGLYGGEYGIALFLKSDPAAPVALKAATVLENDCGAPITEEVRFVVSPPPEWEGAGGAGGMGGTTSGPGVEPEY